MNGRGGDGWGQHTSSADQSCQLSTGSFWCGALSSSLRCSGHRTAEPQQGVDLALQGVQAGKRGQKSRPRGHLQILSVGPEGGLSGPLTGLGPLSGLLQYLISGFGKSIEVTFVTVVNDTKSRSGNDVMHD